MKNVIKMFAKVIIAALATATFIAVGFADSIPENKIWLYMLGIIGSLLVQVFIGYASGVFQDAIVSAMAEDDDDK